MDRRNFLKSIGAAALLPALPIAPASLLKPAVASTAAPAFTANTYKWAEMIVRAHNKCNLGLLQRSLRIDAAAATALKESLISNGVVSAQANTYGIHSATKPLYEGAFMNVSETINKVAKLPDMVEQAEVRAKVSSTNDEHATYTDAPDSVQETESDINDLNHEAESGFQPEDDDTCDREAVFERPEDKQET